MTLTKLRMRNLLSGYTAAVTGLETRESGSFSRREAVLLRCIEARGPGTYVDVRSVGNPGIAAAHVRTSSAGLVRCTSAGGLWGRRTRAKTAVRGADRSRGMRRQSSLTLRESAIDSRERCSLRSPRVLRVQSGPDGPHTTHFDTKPRDTKS